MDLAFFLTEKERIENERAIAEAVEHALVAQEEGKAGLLGVVVKPTRAASARHPGA